MSHEYARRLPDDMEIIEVCCCVFADGTTFWTPDKDGARRAVLAWRSTLSPERDEELKAANVMHGFVLVRMLMKDYKAIGFANSDMTLAYMQNATP